MGEKLIRFDWAVKRVLRSKANFGILEGFLSELLRVDIKILEVLESEGNKETQDDKFNRVDLLVKNSRGELIIIEVQVTSEYDLLSRMLYGAAKAIWEYIKEGDSYKEVKKVYSVNILYFDLGKGDDYVYRGKTIFLGLHTNTELELSEKQKLLYQKEQVSQIFPEYYVIKVNQFNDYAKDALDEWIYFLKNEEIKGEFHARGLKEASEKLRVMKMSEEEQRRYRGYLEDLHYQASMIESSYGVGKLEGIKEGKLEGMKEAALKMKKSNMSLEVIQGVTGLSKEEIENL